MRNNLTRKEFTDEVFYDKVEAGQMRVRVEELTNRNWVWIDLPTDHDDLWEQVDELLNENDAEEWRIADLDVIETYGIKFFEWYDLDELNRIAEILEDVEREVAWLIINNFGEQEGFEILEEENYSFIEAPFTHGGTEPYFEEGDLARILWHEYGYWENIDETLESYIKWVDLERDLFHREFWTIGERYAVKVPY